MSNVKTHMIKINNCEENGRYDYKDLNTDLIVQGTAYYPYLLSGVKYVILKTTQDEMIIWHDDIDFLTQDEWDHWYEKIQRTYDGIDPYPQITESHPVDNTSSSDLLLAMADLAEKQEVDHMTVLLAMADLAETKRGVK